MTTAKDQRPVDVAARAARLAQISRELRILTLETLIEARTGHPGGSLSCVEILAALLFDAMDRQDCLVLSKGHADAVFYAALCLAGHVQRDQLRSMRSFASPLQGHPDARFLNAVEYSSGSLGQGLSFATGRALVGRPGCRVFAVLGDGELQEGQVWEAVLFAAHYRIDKLTVLIDCNGYQLTSATTSTKDVHALSSAWHSLGWDTHIIDGHDPLQLADVCRRAQATPRAIFAVTVKGMGVPFMEHNNDFHGRSLDSREITTVRECIARLRS